MPLSRRGSFSSHEPNDSERYSSFRYGTNDRNGNRLPRGPISYVEEDYEIHDHFWTTGVKKRHRNWSRYHFYGVPQYYSSHCSTDPLEWPPYISETVCPEVLSLQSRQTARIEWKRVGQKLGKDKLKEELIRRGL